MSFQPTFDQEQAFLRSVVYASVFEYPLTLEQLRESLIGVRADSRTVLSWYYASEFLQSRIEFRDGFFFPRGAANMLQLRVLRESISRTMLDELHRPLSLVLAMPFVRMVALSGSLAHLNADGDTDLDLFVVTSKHRVWSVTTTVLLLAKLFGWRKRLCLNYVVSEEQLSVAPRDLFSANQIIHLRPIAGELTYLRFLGANAFVQDIYPNFRPRPVGHRPRRQRLQHVVEWLLDHTVAPVYERLCQRGYGWHLGRQATRWRSRDQVRLEPECLKLHTSSHRDEVMQKFEQALSRIEADSREPSLAQAR